MKKGYDHIIIYTVLALVLIGWLMIYSSSAVMADITYNDSFKFLKKQFLFSLIGLIGMVAMIQINYRRLQTWTYPILILSFILLIVVLIPGLGFSHKVGVARRWLMTPWFGFQPSELGKLALIIFIAYSLAKKGDRIKEFLVGFFPIIAISGIMILLVILERDMGTAIFLGLLTMVLLFLGGTRLSHLLIVPLIAAPVLYVYVTRIPYVMSEYIVDLGLSKYAVLFLVLGFYILLKTY